MVLWNHIRFSFLIGQSGSVFTLAMEKEDKKVGPRIEIPLVGAQVLCYCFHIFQSITCWKHISDCSNHSPCFIHTVSAIKYIAENVNEATLTNLTVLDGCNNPSSHLRSKYQENFSIFFTTTLTWLCRNPACGI